MVKIDEVARAAGVSISTVSYALSGKRPVSAATRTRIESAVEELGYRANAGARMLAGSRTQIFALTEPFRPDTFAPTHMAFVLATSIAARRQDYDILLLTEEDAADGMRRVADSGLVDGILVLDVAPADRRVALARQLDIPSIFIGIPDDHAGLTCVDLDFEAAAALAVDRLVDEGHRGVGLIGHTAIAYENSNFPPRVRAGFERRAAERSVDARFRDTGEQIFSPSVVRAAVADLVADGVTGFVLHCGDDAYEVVLDELARLGRRVPGDASVISVGATFSTTSFAVALDAIPLIPASSCDLAVDLAMRALGASPPAPGVHLIPPTYVTHGSVGPPSHA